MSALQITLLLLYSIGMSAGQLLFKLAAQSFLSPNASTISLGRMAQLGLNPYFVGAMSLYLGLSVLWVWILTFTPLSRAYPFVAVAFVVTPLLGHFFFMEALDLRFYLGLSLIVLGLILVIS